MSRCAWSIEGRPIPFDLKVKPSERMEERDRRATSSKTARTSASVPLEWL